MRFEHCVAVVAMVVSMGSVACGGSSAESGTDQGAVIEGESVQAERAITGAVDARAGTARIAVKDTLVGADLADVKKALSDPSLSFFKALKRPSSVKVGETTVAIGGAGGDLLKDLKRVDNTVEGEMPFAESGLASYSGLKLKLAYKAEDTADGFILIISNPEPVETKLLGLDVVEANGLSLKITATRGEGGVSLNVEQDVRIVRGQEKVGKLLGASVAITDALVKQLSR